MQLEYSKVLWVFLTLSLTSQSLRYLSPTQEKGSLEAQYIVVTIETRGNLAASWGESLGVHSVSSPWTNEICGPASLPEELYKNLLIHRLAARASLNVLKLYMGYSE